MSGFQESINQINFPFRSTKSENHLLIIFIRILPMNSSDFSHHAISRHHTRVVYQSNRVKALNLVPTRAKENVRKFVFFGVGG